MRVAAADASARVAVFAREELPSSRDALTPRERIELDRMGLTGGRAREWIAGRAGAHRVLRGALSIVGDPDGAPRIERARGSISLSHDGAWVAVAVAGDGRIGVDLCSRAHEGRLVGILARLGVRADQPCLAWAALECALKLRRRGVWTLLDAPLAIAPGRGGARVIGIGDDVQVAWRSNDDYAIAWAVEAA